MLAALPCIPSHVAAALHGLSRFLLVNIVCLHRYLLDFSAKCLEKKSGGKIFFSVIFLQYGKREKILQAVRLPGEDAGGRSDGEIK